MQYLIRTIQHNGQPFTDVTKIRENETYQVVEAESKEELEEYLYCEKLERTVSEYETKRFRYTS